MLQVIVLSVCTLGTPMQCADVYLRIESETGASLQVPFHCARQGQIEGQRWVAEHPGWRIQRWRCPSPSEIANLNV
jgi:hypothetical protein